MTAIYEFSLLFVYSVQIISENLPKIDQVAN